MTKSELIQRIAQKQPHIVERDVELAVKMMLDQMTACLASGGRIEIRGFGSFSLRFRPARAARNPRTGTPVSLPARHAPYKTLVGAQMRYAVHDRNGWPLAMLGFSTAAWKLAPRDKFIGWTAQLREKNLPLVVDNPRFLILPWITIPNLGSHILAIVRRRLPQDWTERYHTTPVLIETFVETPRYTGAVYKASGWVRVGTTQGRGRYDRDKQYDKPKKDIWLRPLRRDWQRTLNRQNLAAIAVCV